MEIEIKAKVGMKELQEHAAAAQAILNNQLKAITESLQNQIVKDVIQFGEVQPETRNQVYEALGITKTFRDALLDSVRFL